MLEDGNLAGLIKLLKSEYLQVSILAADYIAQIGDMTALEPLLKASSKWEGSNDDNPYIAAIKMILERTRPVEEPKEEIPEVEVIEEVEEIEIPDEPVIEETPVEPNSVMPVIVDPNSTDPNIPAEPVEF